MKNRCPPHLLMCRIMVTHLHYRKKAIEAEKRKSEELARSKKAQEDIARQIKVVAQNAETSAPKSKEAVTNNKPPTNKPPAPQTELAVAAKQKIKEKEIEKKKPPEEVSLLLLLLLVHRTGYNNNRFLNHCKP